MAADAGLTKRIEKLEQTVETLLKENRELRTRLKDVEASATASAGTLRDAKHGIQCGIGIHKHKPDRSYRGYGLRSVCICGDMYYGDRGNATTLYD